jgi:hypothetical protein
MAKKNDTKSAVVESISESDIQGMLEGGKYKDAQPDLVKLEVGQAVRGIFDSVGSYDATDIKTGVLKKIPCYNIKTDAGVMVRLAGVTKMDAAFGGIKVGSRVIVFRGADVTTAKGRKCAGIRVLQPTDES